MNIRNLIILFFSLGVFTTSFGQDIHFSQFYMSPLNLNPAMTGVMNCTQRFVGNYRSQWATYNTYSFSYDRKKGVGKADYFGFGGTAWADVAGASKYGTTQGKLSFSFSKKVGGGRKGGRYIVAGADAGFTQRRISSKDLLWPGQHNDKGGIKPGGAGGGTIENQSFLYPDLSGGLLYFDVHDDKISYYIGIAGSHLNRANVSFQGGDVSLFTKLTFHGGGEFRIGNSMTLVPAFVYYKQGPHTELNLGTSLKFGLAQGRNGNNQAFQMGMWFRSGRSYTVKQVENEDPITSTSFASNALIFSTRFDYQSYGFGFSYDYELTDANIGGGSGSFEFSMVYLICGNTSRGIYCPSF